jgi:hypothetical protein
MRATPVGRAAGSHRHDRRHDTAGCLDRGDGRGPRAAPRAHREGSRAPPVRARPRRHRLRWLQLRTVSGRGSRPAARRDHRAGRPPVRGGGQAARPGVRPPHRGPGGVRPHRPGGVEREPRRPRLLSRGRAHRAIMRRRVARYWRASGATYRSYTGCVRSRKRGSRLARSSAPRSQSTNRGGSLSPRRPVSHGRAPITSTSRWTRPASSPTRTGARTWKPIQPA